MATPGPDDSNILDAETVDWRLVVYPLLAVLILLVGGFGFYYYRQTQRDLNESQAREALLKAKAPEEMTRVADQFPSTDHAAIAMLAAGDASFAARNYDASAAAYQRVLSTSNADPALRDSAQLGVASTLEASGKSDEAINAYLEVGRRGDKSPLAPYAYHAAAQIYERRGDKDNERKIFTELAGLNPDSEFVKDAQFKLKELNAIPASGMPAATADPTSTPPPAGANAPTAIAPTPEKK